MINYLIIFYIIVVGVIAVYFYKYITFKNAFDKAGIITIGKTLLWHRSLEDTGRLKEYLIM